MCKEDYKIEITKVKVEEIDIAIMLNDYLCHLFIAFYKICYSKN